MILPLPPDHNNSYRIIVFRQPFVLFVLVPRLCAFDIVHVAWVLSSFLWLYVFSMCAFATLNRRNL